MEERTTIPAFGLVAQPGLIASRILAQGRLRVLRLLGRGGMGVVYEALDSERGEHVALKCLAHVDASGIYRLKQEFRSLADVRHRNLIGLHELFCEEGSWFFSMELVAGVTFSEWVRPDGNVNELQLRAALVQLIDGVSAIHAAGKLHRDLKPSNVLVAQDGRVVILDFGLATEAVLGVTRSDALDAGTPAYMAPEQAAGQLASSASDVYAIGVMLFEALTGRLPFEGGIGAMLAGKLRDEPPALAEFGVADHPLSALCARMLARDPSARPDLPALREWLGPRDAQLVSTAPPVRAGLLCREAELEVLHRSFAKVLEGASVLQVVSGESGIGKTALCEYFLEELRATQSALVFSSRCYERERVPFKAFDALMDQLSGYLRRLPVEQAAWLFPRYAGALARLFPTLCRVQSLAELDPDDTTTIDTVELRRRAFRALSELLSRLAERQPVVLHIDDLHWADTDSVLLLRHLVTRGSSGKILLLVSQRDASDFDFTQRELRFELNSLALFRLPPSAASVLAAALLPVELAEREHYASAIALQSRGHPFFAQRLAWFVAHTAVISPSALTLSEALAARIASLPVPARTLLELLAIAGSPLPQPIALRAAEASAAELDQLCEVQLARMRTRGERRVVECYHDLIRDHVSAASDDAARPSLFRRLADQLEAEAHSDAELRSRCLEGAGDRAGAANQALIAAEQASSVLAFDRAAALYRKAIELQDDATLERAALLEKLGHALYYGGRGPEAAAVYEEAARSCEGDRALELRWYVASNLLKSGQLEAGRRVLRELAGELGVTFPASNFSARMSLALRMRRLRKSGFRLDPAPAPISARLALRMRTASTSVVALNNLPLQAACAATQYLEIALRAGDRGYACNALGYCISAHGLMPNSAGWVRELRGALSRLAHEDGSRLAIATSEHFDGIALTSEGAFRRARRRFERSLPVLREYPGHGWMIDNTHIFDVGAAFALGDFLDIAALVPQVVEEARQRNRIWVATMLTGYSGSPAWLLSDDAAGYRRELAYARAHWKRGPQPEWPDFHLLIGEVLLLLYTAEPLKALSLLMKQEATYARALLNSSLQHAGIYLSSTAACAAAVLGHDRELTASKREICLATIARAAPKLREMGWLMHAEKLEAAAARYRGQRARAAEHLQAALAAADQVGARMQAAAMRRRLGRILNSDAGDALIEQGEAVMVAQQVKNIEAMTELLCAGFETP